MTAVPAPTGWKVVCSCESPPAKVTKVLPSVPTVGLLSIRFTLKAATPGRIVRVPA